MRTSTSRFNCYPMPSNQLNEWFTTMCAWCDFVAHFSLVHRTWSVQVCVTHGIASNWIIIIWYCGACQWNRQSLQQQQKLDIHATHFYCSADSVSAQNTKKNPFTTLYKTRSVRLQFAFELRIHLVVSMKLLPHHTPNEVMSHWKNDCNNQQHSNWCDPSPASKS